MEARLRSLKPAGIVLLLGYVTLAVVLLGIGYLLTHVLNDSIGRWDEHVNEHFARTRTTGWNDITKFATSALNTLPVIALAAIISGILWLRHRAREAAFLVLALIIEVTVFLSVTFLVARPRPDVHRLNSTPSTSSFPSGHTAAATVLFVGAAIIVACLTSRWFLRALAGVGALGLSALVGFARVYRGLHHPTDVFVGFVFGLACLAVSALAVRAVASRSTAATATDSESRSTSDSRDGLDVLEPPPRRAVRTGV
jgi:undecaprenyl-diphosphatase